MAANPSAALTPPRELCSRTADRIEITLLWVPETDGLRVSVVDSRLNHAFEIPVAASSAMRAFHHPYAYAAERGLLECDWETGTSTTGDATRSQGVAP
jgi:hypothetical protein